MENRDTIFKYAAKAGLTKHVGGLESTEELVRLCRIGSGSRVLDVGCGVGATPCYLVKAHGCRVVGVDISPAMIERSRERASKQGLGDRVEFRAADAQDLPFPDGVFDVVITESVTAFPPDKGKAVGEYVRVLKPGGYLGLAEITWLKMPPPPELVDWASRDESENAMPLSVDAWVDLLKDAGLQDVVANPRQVDLRDSALNLVRRYGVGEFLSIMGRIIKMLATDPDYRAFAKRVKQQGILPKSAREYFGFGIYVGRKSM